MATTPIKPSATSVTLIEALQARYDAAQTAYNALETADYDMPDSPEGKMRSSHLRDGQKYIYEEQGAIEATILNQRPTTWQDAFILATHVTSVGSDITAYVDDVRERKQENVARGLESLLTFIADENGLDGSGSAFLSDVLENARRRDLMRDGRPLEDEWLSKAA